MFSDWLGVNSLRMVEHDMTVQFQRACAPVSYLLRRSAGSSSVDVCARERGEHIKNRQAEVGTR